MLFVLSKMLTNMHALIFMLILCSNYRYLRYIVVAAEEAYTESLFHVTWDYNGQELSFHMDIPIPEGEKGVDEGTIA